MNWDNLISDKRLGMEHLHTSPANEVRSDFRRDFDRVIFSSPFRRLQNKTQVFPLPGHIFVHNRLTHSLEVSSVGRSMANRIEELLLTHHTTFVSAKIRFIGDIVATACLCHDLGNPPFGHSGEKTISSFFSEGPGLTLKDEVSPSQWNDFIHFEGNANSFRLLSHQFAGRRKGGFAMTYSTLASIIKYPYPSSLAGDKGKFGFFTSEKNIYYTVAQELGIIETSPDSFARHPLTYIMEAADDICYQIMDIEDAHKLKIISHDETRSLLLAFFEDTELSNIQKTIDFLADPNERIGYLRSKVIGVLVEACAKVFVENEESIMGGSFPGNLLNHTAEQLRHAWDNCTEIAWKKIYCAREVIDVEIAGNRIITSLLNEFIGAILSPEKNYSKLLLRRVPQQYDINAPTLYGRIQAILDHISGMTDVYALDLYRSFNGHILPAV